MGNVYDMFAMQLHHAEQKLERVSNNAAPTLPIYNMVNPPQDAVEGQVVIGDDDRLYWYSHGQWRTNGSGLIGAAGKWAYGQANLLADLTHADFFSFSEDGSGTIVYDSVNKRFTITASGSYKIEAICEWQTTGSTPITDLFKLFITESSSQAGQTLGETVTPGTLDGALKRWQLDQADIFNVTGSGYVYITGSTTGGSSSLSGDAALFITRIGDSVTDLFAAV